VALDAPPQAWQAAARWYVKRAARDLESTDNFLCLDYLHQRGFTDNTIVALGFGRAVSRVAFRSEDLGLPVNKSVRTGEPVPVLFPAGITIPVEVGGVLAAVKSRRTQADALVCGCGGRLTGPGRCVCGVVLPRYRNAPGGVHALYPLGALRGHATLVLIGDVLTAALLNQEAAGAELAIDCLSWSDEETASGPSPQQLAPYANALSHVQTLVALRDDAVAIRTAEALMCHISAKLVEARLPDVPGAKAIPGWNTREIDLRAWLAGELARAADSGGDR